jgi:predicted TIM-barrel fold metal-dependent hydrolase
VREGNVIFDMVVHVHNIMDQNFTPVGKVAQSFQYDYVAMYRRHVQQMPSREEHFSTPPSPEAVAAKIFHEGSQIDYAMAQVVPLFDLFVEAPEKNVERVHQLVQLAPERFIFCGGTDPILRGLNTALRDIDFQISELDAKSMKFYNAHSLGNSWRMDDRRVAYPMYERMLELGVNLAQVHKGDPQGLEPLDALRPDDVHQAALDFPEMNFIVHHLAFPFEDAAIDLASRLPNVYLSMSTWINMINVAPVETAMRIGKMMRWCRTGKIIWGSEVPLWPSAQRLLDLCWQFQMPEDLVEGWGFPEITDEDRRKMFGANMLRLLGMPEEPPRVQTAA